MAVKTVEMVRKIRDKHYEKTKAFSGEEQIKFVKKKSEDLQKDLRHTEKATALTKIYSIRLC